MTNLENLQDYWETAWKVFDKIEDKDKMNGFNSLIEEVEGNEQIGKLKEIWNSMTEKQKYKLYKKGAINLTHFITNGCAVYQVSRSAINAFINAKNNWAKNATKYAFLEQIPCRFLVELGIFDKPEKLSDEQLIKDVKKDAKNYNLYLWIAETACTFIPDAQAAVPFIAMARKYTKWYEEHWTEVMIAKLREKKEEKIKKDTNEALAQTLTQEPTKKAA